MKTPMTKLMLAAMAATLLCLGARAASNDWMVVDIKTGEVFYHDYDFATATNTFSAPVYKTEKMAFRRIPAGLYHIQDGTAYAFIRYDYYLSIFPVTVGQHASMTNRSAKVWAAGQYIEEMQRAQHNVSWRKWRGTDLPSENDWISNVGEDFWANSEYSDCPLWELDKRVLRATHDVNYSFDFPTRAMWEVAARAMPAGDGSHKTWKWFWGETIDGVELYANTNSYYSSQKVGSRLPNDWGFYDIYGTCWEWCQDGEGAVPVSSRYAALYEHSEWPHMPDADNPDQRLICGKADFGASYSYDYWKDGSGLGIGARIAVLRYQECSAAPVMITFKNETGETLQSATEMPFGESVYAYSFDTGSYIYYKGPRPTKAGNAQYYYTFSGWDQDYAISNAVVTAVFERHVCNYAVNWVNWDGSQLISNDFDYGDLPYYPGATPTKPPTVEYDYTFTGWSPEPAAVTGETTYVAQFTQSARKYDITWLNYDGSTNATTRTPYNTIPEFEGETPAKPSTVQYAYTFAGWTPELEPATRNIAYTAMFDESIREYPVNFYNNTGSELLFTTNVPYGSTPEYLGETPTKPSTAQYHYSFAGWGRDMMVVDGPSFYNNYYAEFDPILRSYDITWANWDGSVLCVTNVPYGTIPAYLGETPTKPPTDTTRFTFSGWTTPVASVTGEATYTADYSARVYRIDISSLSGEYIAYDGDVFYGTQNGHHPIRLRHEGMSVTLAGIYLADSILAYTNNVTIVIADGTTNTIRPYYGFPAIALNNAQSSITIKGDENGTGILDVKGGDNCAAIGPYASSPSKAGGSIAIDGGTVIASGGSDAPGIGSGASCSCGEITIRGGTVRASGVYGIGSTSSGHCVGVTIEETVSRVVASGTTAPIRVDDDNVAIAQGLKQLYGNNDRTVTIAPYESYCTIVWQNYDGTILSSEELICGDMPVYRGTQPTKAPSATERYLFAGWTPAIEAATSNATYTATYTATELGTLLAHLSFDDYGNDGLNVLKASVGEDAIVRTTKANIVEGLGAVKCVTDETILAGLPEGDGAVEIPLRTHIALPIPEVLTTESGTPYSILMKVKFPSFGRYYSVFTMPAANNSDMMVFLTDSSSPGIILKQPERVVGAGGFTAGKWETLLFLFDRNNTRVLLNGTQIFSYGYTLAGSRADCANAGGYILLAGDEDGEDNLMYFADVKVYDGIVPDTTGIDTYVARWVNYDGTELEVDENVLPGTVPSYDGATPTRPANGGIDHVFIGWTPAVAPIASNVTYTATYVSGILHAFNDTAWAQQADGSFKSKTIGDNGNTSVSIDVSGPGTLMFKWKVSSESDYDYLRFYRGGSEVKKISGEKAWAIVSNRVDDTGAVTFKWAYTKDGSESRGSDCGWIKDVVWIPDAQGTQVFVNGESVDFERGEGGRTLAATVPAGTLAQDVPVKVDGIDVSKGFARSVEGTQFTATLLAPYEVPKEEGAPNDIWTENGDGTVTLNVTVVPGLYYAADSAASLDGLKCPGASAPATGATTLTTPKPAGGTGFFKVWVSDAPIAAEP